MSLLVYSHDHLRNHQSFVELTKYNVKLLLKKLQVRSYTSTVTHKRSWDEVEKLLHMSGTTCRKTGIQGKFPKASKCDFHFWNLKTSTFLKFCMFKFINFKVFQLQRAKNLRINVSIFWSKWTFFTLNFPQIWFSHVSIVV